jgi:hypothetical protein
MTEISRSIFEYSEQSKEFINQVVSGLSETPLEWGDMNATRIEIAISEAQLQGDREVIARLTEYSMNMSTEYSRLATIAEKSLDELDRRNVYGN